VLQDSLSLLDDWAQRPVSHWLTLCDAPAGDPSQYREAIENLLAAVVDYDAPLDLWIVREGVVTAWVLAPRDRHVTEEAALRARLQVERMALALLVRTRLPARTLAALTWAAAA
jgi:hypothetical protein